MGGKGSGAKPKDYPPELVENVRDLYELGHTMREVAVLAGISVKVLQVLMPRYGIKRRLAAKRDQAGERNAMWRGDAAGYQALHLRVQAARGKPAACSACDKDDPNATYEWANLTGNYDSVTDYIRLCVACHRRFDAATRRRILKAGDRDD